MTDESLPPDLEALERDLIARRGVGEPSEALRQRVLEGVRTEIRRSSLGSDTLWKIGRVAALALLWVNASWSAALVTDFGLRPQSTVALENARQEVLRVLPTVTADQATSLAFASVGRRRARWLPTADLRWTNPSAAADNKFPKY